MNCVPVPLEVRTYSAEAIVNVGVGSDLTILELARLVADVIGYRGRMVTDPSKPDRTPRKLLDVSRLTYEWFLAHQALLRH